MISIITAIHNQKAMNILFYEYLVKYMSLPYELIIIDNNSTDGSREFFQSKNVIVIANKVNYSYPYCQNQGIQVAKYKYLAFLNNDILVSKHWDTRSIQIMEQKKIDVATCLATDRMESNDATYKTLKKWKYIRNPLLYLFGPNYTNLKLMHVLHNGNWEKNTEARYLKFGHQTIDGISGSNIIMNRECIDKIGLWDERIQGGDFDLFLRVKKRFVEVGDIKPVQLLLGVYLQHYIRLTSKHKPAVFADKANLIPLLKKWDRKEALILLKNSGLII